MKLFGSPDFHPVLFLEGKKQAAKTNYFKHMHTHPHEKEREEQREEGEGNAEKKLG